MSSVTPEISLDPGQPFERLLQLSQEEVEQAQLEAVQQRFAQLRGKVSALDTLATRQGVDAIERLDDVAPLLFDHRVYKSYPMSIVEQRRFGRLTTWLQRLTAHDVASVPMDDVTSVDAWLERLDEHGMIMLHSTGTTGKLSFLPRSRAEWPVWQDAFFEAMRAATGVDRRKEALPRFFPGYRSGHTGSVKMQRIFTEVSAGGEADRHCLYDYPISSDLMSLAARLRTAEERGELDKLDLDAELLRQREQLIAQGRSREQDLERWFTKLADEFRGQRVQVDGVTADLIRLALKGREMGLQCSFAPGSVLFTAGGMKGLKEVPEDWQGLLTSFFDVDRVTAIYGMSECMGIWPLCGAGFYHFFPHTVPLLLDPDGEVLPRQGVRTGRLALFDLLAQSYWGGFISGDRITVHWDADCPCGWRTPRVEPDIRRFSELEGGDDKISCAGTEEAYSEFMSYVSEI